MAVSYYLLNGIVYKGVQRYPGEGIDPVCENIAEMTAIGAQLWSVGDSKVAAAALVAQKRRLHGAGLQELSGIMLSALSSGAAANTTASAANIADLQAGNLPSTTTTWPTTADGRVVCKEGEVTTIGANTARPFIFNTADGEVWDIYVACLAVDPVKNDAARFTLATTLKTVSGNIAITGANASPYDTRSDANLSAATGAITVSGAQCWVDLTGVAGANLDWGVVWQAQRRS